MSYTRTDLQTIESAILELAAGTAVVSFTIGGKTIEFHQNRLENLLKLRTVIQRELGLAPTTLYLRNAGRSRT
jgi:hypothetical protein